MMEKVVLKQKGQKEMKREESKVQKGSEREQKETVDVRSARNVGKLAFRRATDGPTWRRRIAKESIKKLGKLVNKREEQLKAENNLLELKWSEAMVSSVDQDERGRRRGRRQERARGELIGARSDAKRRREMLRTPSWSELCFLEKDDKCRRFAVVGVLPAATEEDIAEKARNEVFWEIGVVLEMAQYAEVSEGAVEESCRAGLGSWTLECQEVLRCV